MPTPGEARIRQALCEPTSFDFAEESLSALAEFVGERHHIQVLLHERALRNIGVDGSDGITIRVRDMPLRSALRLTLCQHDLTFVVRDGYLLITSRAEEETMKEARVYPVGDLVTGAGQPIADIAAHYELLATLIPVTVSSYSWQFSDRPPRLDTFQAGRALVAYQSQTIHEEIESLLAALRAARDDQGKLAEPPGPTHSEPQSALPKRPTEAYPRPNKTQQEIAQRLSARTELQFHEAPLVQLLDELQRVHQIQAVIDRDGLGNAGISLDVPINFHLTGLTLREALNSILSELDLTYILRDDVLWITSKDIAENMTTTKVYPVLDLIITSDSKESARGEYDSLVQLIVANISTTTWDDGDEGSVMAYPPAGAIVVRQTAERHNEVQRLLDALRAAHDLAETER
ncbi:MAG TPA: hypothetical protein VFI31_02405 [Pirellulales bacterium]|nr:hypothetical protein [Pirellulales bacterium]